MAIRKATGMTTACRPGNDEQGENTFKGMPLGSVPPFTQEAGKYHTDANHTSYDFHADSPFDLFGRKHELSVGASRRASDFYQRGGW